MIHESREYFVKFYFTPFKGLKLRDFQKSLDNSCEADGRWNRSKSNDVYFSFGPFHNQKDAIKFSNSAVHIAIQSKISLRDW